MTRTIAEFADEFMKEHPAVGEKLTRKDLTEIWESLALLFGIPLLVMAVMWSFADARESGHPVGRFWGILLLLAFGAFSRWIVLYISLILR